MRRKSLLTVCFAAALTALLAAGPAAPQARAEVMFNSYVYDSFGQLVPVQPPYRPVGHIGGELFAADPEDPGKRVPSPMSNPSDVFIDGNDRIYIADTGNNRVLVLAPNGQLDRIIAPEDSPFNQPQGLYVDDETGDIYVADTGNKRVVRLDREGRLLKEYTDPQSPFMPTDYKYDPIKLAVDKRGFLFIATLGGYQGLLQLDPDGNFVGFFGANTLQISPLQKSIENLKRMLYSEEMLANQLSSLPGSIGNVTIDDRGFIYTVSSGPTVKNQQVKKLNIKGKNMIAKDDELSLQRSLFKIGVSQPNRSFGEVTRRQLRGKTPDQSLPLLTDAAVDRYGNIAVIDGNFKNISIYDADGNSLFFWTGNAESDAKMLGLHRSPVAAAFNSKNELFILDSQDQLLTKYELTDFGRMVFEANALTAEGRYEESAALWNKVLHFNAAYPPALNGLARAKYQEGDFEEALRLFHLGQNQTEYSNVFWQLRIAWLQRYFGEIATALLFGGVVLWIGMKLFSRSRWGEKWKRRKRSTAKLVVQLRHAFHVMRHPIDGFADLRYEAKGGYAGALILLGLAVATNLLSNYFTSFSFNKIDRETIRLLPMAAQFLIVWLAWVVCHYFIGSIMRGEARFKDVFVGSAYALVPLIVFGIPLTLLSNILTLNELPIYQFIHIAMVVWTGLMFLWCIQSLQNYFVLETLLSIVVSLLAMIAVAVLFFLIYSLSLQLFEFIASIYREVILR